MKPSAAKRIGAAVLAVAVLVGGIGKFFPHWFFNLPFPLSIILWISTGHLMPPFFMTEAWAEDEIDTWTKDGDLVVATGSKSGTTFMLYCTHQIRTRGTDVDDELFPDASISTPWPDLRHSRAGTWADQKERMNTTILPDGRPMKDIWDNPGYPFRIWKSHWAPPILPVRRKEGEGKKLKYVAMTRNGIDVAASMSVFYSAMTPRFRNLWGGFPPIIPDEVMDGPEPPAAVKDMLPGGPSDHMYFGYVKAWWPYRNDPNVLLMHYSDVRKDLRGHVSKIAKFLGVDLTSGELDRVTQRCTVEHMRTVPAIRYKMPLNQDKGLWDVDKDQIMEDGAMTKHARTGGSGAFIFSDEVVARWKKAEEDQFGHDPAMLKWAREGGKYPDVE